jgi:hypothetical protein
VDLLRERQHVTARLMWEHPGPKDTRVAWISCYLLQRGNRARLLLVETYKNGAGYDYFLQGEVAVHSQIAEEIEGALA